MPVSDCLPRARPLAVNRPQQKCERRRAEADGMVLEITMPNVPLPSAHVSRCTPIPDGAQPCPPDRPCSARCVLCPKQTSFTVDEIKEGFHIISSGENLGARCCSKMAP